MIWKLNVSKTMNWKKQAILLFHSRIGHATYREIDDIKNISLPLHSSGSPYRLRLKRSNQSICAHISESMDRGNPWDAAENEKLAKPWVPASEDVRVGRDQTGEKFNPTARHVFFKKSRKENALFGRYECRSERRIARSFFRLLADI